MMELERIWKRAVMACYYNVERLRKVANNLRTFGMQDEIRNKLLSNLNLERYR
jgi:hypothetical protein